MTVLGLGAFFLLTVILVKLTWPRMSERMTLYANQNEEARS